MTRRPLTTAALFALAGCGGAPRDDESAREHDHAEGVDHHEPAAAAPAPPKATAAPASPQPLSPQPFAMGAWTAELTPTADGLRLTAKDADGVAVKPTGEARVVLTGAGEDAQRVVLSPAEAGWAGSARATGAQGYVAVVSAEVDGHTETARVTWGDVPDVAPARAPGDPAGGHDDAHEHGHGHGH